MNKIRSPITHARFTTEVEACKWFCHQSPCIWILQPGKCMNFPTKKKLWQSYWLLKQQRLKKIPDFSRMNAGWIDMVPLISPLRSVPLITEASFGKPRRSIQRINRKNMVESWKILWVWFVFKSGKLKSVRFQKKKSPFQSDSLGRVPPGNLPNSAI